MLDFCRRNYYFYVPVMQTSEILLNTEQLDEIIEQNDLNL